MTQLNTALHNKKNCTIMLLFVFFTLVQQSLYATECFVCSGLEPSLLKSEVTAAMQALPTWEMDTSSGSKLSKSMSFTQPDDIVSFVEKINCFSCKNYHKVEFTITPKEVKLCVYDPFLRNVTRADVSFAKKLNSFIISEVLASQEKDKSIYKKSLTKHACCQSCAQGKECEGEKELIAHHPAGKENAQAKPCSSQQKNQTKHACCQSCAKGKECKGKKEDSKPCSSQQKNQTKHACCQSCAKGKECEGKKEDSKPCSSQSKSVYNSYKKINSASGCIAKTQFNKRSEDSEKSTTSSDCCYISEKQKEKEKNIIALYNQKYHEISKKKVSKDTLMQELTTQKEWSSMNLGVPLMRKWFSYQDAATAVKNAKLVVRMYTILRREVELYLYDSILRVDFKKAYNQSFVLEDLEAVWAVDSLITE